MTAVTCQRFSNSLCHNNCHYLVAKYRHTVTECCILRNNDMIQDWHHKRNWVHSCAFSCRESWKLPFHAFLGCDSTSSFRGKGGKKAFHIPKNHTDRYMDLALLGEHLHLDDIVLDCCIQFICRLYLPKSDISDLYQLLIKMFYKKPIKIKVCQHVMTTF